MNKGQRISPKLVISIFAILIIVVFAWTVWPTLYRYDRVSTNSESAPVRINRFTGTVEVIGLTGWIKLTEHEKPVETQTAIPVQAPMTAAIAPGPANRESANKIIVPEGYVLDAKPKPGDIFDDIVEADSPKVSTGEAKQRRTESITREQGNGG